MQSNATHSQGQAAPQTEPPSQHWEPAAEGAAAAADGNEIDQISVARSMNLRRSDQLVLANAGGKPTRSPGGRKLLQKIGLDLEKARSRKPRKNSLSRKHRRLQNSGSSRLS